MRKRRIGPMLLAIIVIGAAAFSYTQQARANRFDTAFTEFVKKAQDKTIEVASQRDTAEEFFGWIEGQGLTELKALPAPVAGFQQYNYHKVVAMFEGMAKRYRDEPLMAVSVDNYQGFYTELGNVVTAISQAREEPSEF